MHFHNRFEYYALLRRIVLWNEFYISVLDAFPLKMAPGTTSSKNNVLPLWGNDKTMNLNNLILTNIQSSHYFKVNLFELKTYHEVIDEIYYKVFTVHADFYIT